MQYKPPKHFCTLKRQVENIGYVSRLSKFHQIFYLPSKINSKTKHRLPSLGAMLKEARRISRMKKKCIHPLSLFRVIWEMCSMIFIYVGFFAYPLHVCFSLYPKAYMTKLGLTVLAVQAIGITDVILSHMTGYYDDDKEEAVLEKHQIFKRFWKSISNILVLLSSIPYGIFLVLFGPLDSKTMMMSITNLLLLLKAFETRKFLNYFDEVLIMLNMNPIKAKLIEVIMLGGVLTHWMGCCFYIIPTYAELLFNFQIEEGCWIKMKTDRKEYEFYIDMLFRSVSLIISTGHEELLTRTNLDSIVMLVLLIIAEVFIKISIVYVLDVIHLSSAATTNYEMELDKLNSYMRYKKLSLATQKRIISYYDYKFERMYLDEKGLASAVSETLHDINSYIRHKMIKSIHLLRYLDDSVIDDITYHMKEEIYLPNDIIIKSNTHATCMYFLYSGTVCIKTPNGKEVCHISEGSYFGEIGLIKERKRTADVIALEICHVFRLDRKVCKTYLFSIADIMEEIKKTAEDRIEETKKVEEAHKRLLMEKIIHMDTERYERYDY